MHVYVTISEQEITSLKRVMVGVGREDDRNDANVCA